MKCEIVERRLLAAERPDQVAATVKRHLADCPACRAVYRRLVQIERDLPLVPVPVSTRRPAFVAQFLQQTPAELPASEHLGIPLVKLTPRSLPVKERGMRKLAFAFALAASLAFFAIGFWALNFKPAGTRPPDYVAIHKIHLLSRLATADTARDKAETVLGVADEVGDEARTLAAAKDADAERLAALAKFYQQLVRTDLQDHINALPADGKRRAALNQLVDRLEKTESEFTALAATKAGTPAEKPFQDIALAARQTCNDIHKILTEEAI